MEDIPYVSDLPPIIPNVYSDGSFTHPKYPVYGLSTCSTWWPHRLSCMPHQLEQEFSYAQQDADGLTSMLRLLGYTSSSSRAELQ
eukprot:3794912-Karenia_brevis.AAC.1